MIEMKPQFAHYRQEGVILNEEAREQKKKISQAMNQGFVLYSTWGLVDDGYTDTVRGSRPN